jgi:hypothetical protein
MVAAVPHKLISVVGVVDNGIGSAGCVGDLRGVSNGQWRC